MAEQFDLGDIDSLEGVDEALSRVAQALANGEMTEVKAFVQSGEVFGKERLEQAALAVPQSRHFLFSHEIEHFDLRMFQSVHSL